MCHSKPIAAFPDPTEGEAITGAIQAYRYGPKAAANRIAIIPDIYGYKGFYQGLARYYEEKEASVYLVDPFHGLGDLKEETREEAFARRGKVKDKSFLDDFEAFCSAQEVTGVLGFCLGGLYVFELARRGMNASLVGLYGFPQGLPNQDVLPTPFDYLDEVEKRHVMLMGATDESVGQENILRLSNIAGHNINIVLTVYDGVGHNFLPMLDSKDPTEFAVAQDALSRCDRELLAPQER